MEEWKIINNTSEDYMISNQGRIKSKRNKDKEYKIMKPYLNKIGYYDVWIRYNNTPKRKHQYIHRLVAAYFIGDGKGKEVNHKDGNKTNNRVENLEYVTSSGNTEHAVKNKLLIPWNNPRKPIIAINLETGEEIEFISISKAEVFFNSRHISDVLKGKRNMVKGFTFRYKGGD